MNNEKGTITLFFSYVKCKEAYDEMIKAAMNAKKSGVAVFVLDSLSQNIESMINEKPSLVVIKHIEEEKRYKDIEYYIQEGIHVYTLVCAQDVESLHEKVQDMTGTISNDIIPDSFIEKADYIKFIDLDIQKLDTPYSKEQCEALKEMCSFYIYNQKKKKGLDVEENKKEHILVCLSSAPTNGKIIRTAARMQSAFNSQFTALYVETPDFSVASDENKKRLRDNQKLAESLGAKVEVVYGEDVPFQIAEFARLSGVTKIVLGRSAIKRKKILGKPSFTEQLLSYAPDIDIHIIPDKNADSKYRPNRVKETGSKSIFANTIKSGLILIGATILSLLFRNLGFTDSNIIMVYILGVLLTSVATSHQLYSLVSSIASVIIFNYLFTVPRFTLMAYGTGYPVTFIVMFLTAYITGNFAIRYKEQAGQSAKIAYRTKILFDTNQLLSKAIGKEEIINATGDQLLKLLDRNVVIYEVNEGVLGQIHIYQNNENVPSEMNRELQVVKWVLRHNHIAGATTDVFSNVQYMYLALRINDRVYGVVGIDTKENPLDASEHEILLSILGESALALENEKNARDKEAAAILAESEQLRANLLRAISHDLRTPLTTISGNASNLLNKDNHFDEETLQQIYTDMYNDSKWLINLVENLLYSTRIEEGRMNLQFSDELVNEIIETAILHVKSSVDQHIIEVECEDDMMLAQADAKLIVQVIINIIDNATKYAPANTTIKVIAKRNKDMAEIQICDQGKGIPDAEKEKVFDKFYSGNNKIVDNRRSLGLGLYLCKSIVEAHGGKIYARDNEPKGTIIGFTIPLKEINVYE